MKVYVITKGSYSDYHICSVCLDRETAERRMKLFSDNFDEAEIEEFDTDEYEVFVKVGCQIRRRDGKWLYRVLMDEYKDGDKMIQHTRVRVQEICEYNMKETCCPSKEYYRTECGVVVPGTNWGLDVYARDEKEAAKIAYDRIAKMKWEMLEKADQEAKMQLGEEIAKGFKEGTEGWQTC
jgi:hypothetical protein